MISCRYNVVSVYGCGQVDLMLFVVLMTNNKSLTFIALARCYSSSYWPPEDSEYTIFNFCIIYRVLVQTGVAQSWFDPLLS